MVHMGTVLFLFRTVRLNIIVLFSILFSLLLLCSVYYRLAVEGLHGFNTVSNLCSVYYRLAVEGLHGFSTVSNLCSVYYRLAVGDSMALTVSNLCSVHYRLAVGDSMALTLFLTCVLCITD